MSVRSLGRDNEELDNIICYFMRTILHLQNTGIENLPIAGDFAEPIKSFISLAIDMITDGQPPEIARLILEAEYDVILSSGQVNRETALNLHVIKELSYHIHYDENYYDYLLSLSNLWGNTACRYASLTFYPNLPDEVKEKHQIYNLIKYIPQEMFKPNDY